MVGPVVNVSVRSPEKAIAEIVKGVSTDGEILILKGAGPMGADLKGVKAEEALALRLNGLIAEAKASGWNAFEAYEKALGELSEQIIKEGHGLGIRVEAAHGILERATIKAVGGSFKEIINSITKEMGEEIKAINENWMKGIYAEMAGIKGAYYAKGIVDAEKALAEVNALLKDERWVKLTKENPRAALMELATVVTTARFKAWELVSRGIEKIPGISMAEKVKMTQLVLEDLGLNPKVMPLTTWSKDVLPNMVPWLKEMKAGKPIEATVKTEKGVKSWGKLWEALFGGKKAKAAGAAMLVLAAGGLAYWAYEESKEKKKKLGSVPVLTKK